jgi:hypothetical protein
MTEPPAPAGSAAAAAPAADPWPDQPVVHEVNTAVWLAEVSTRAGRPLTLAEVPDPEWDALTPAGVNLVWLMGVWERSAAGRAIALSDPALRASWSSALPDWTPDDVAGSPYCIRDYVPAGRLGGWAGLDAARHALRRRGALLMLDWVPNHVGPDCPWLESHPQAFVRGTAEELAADPDGYLEVGGTVFARGKDPYFAPWPDVIQVDAFAPALRRLAAEALTEIAAHADAVRCDMAMLMLDDVVAQTWRDRVSPAPETPYWTHVIGAVRQAHPAFRFVAEAYWDREWDLQQLGFAHCYDKRLYDHLAHGRPADAGAHLGADLGYQRGLVRFLENHDEPRAAAVFAPAARAQACAIAVATLPGMTLWHEGQADGRRVALPVFLGRRPDEPLDPGLADWHRRLWAAAAEIRRGGWTRHTVAGWPDHPPGSGLLAWSWSDGDALTVVVVNLADTPAAGLVQLGWAPAAGRRWTLTDRLDGATYPCDGADLARDGLYVARDGWGAHVLAAEPRERT